MAVRIGLAFNLKPAAPANPAGAPGSFASWLQSPALDGGFVKSGTGTLTFSDANHGTWSYSIDGFSGVKSITRQPF